jgi:hypothetical protein
MLALIIASIAFARLHPKQRSSLLAPAYPGRRAESERE